MEIQTNNDILKFLVSKADSGAKNWFNFQEQKITGINLAYEISKNHADKMTPEEIVDFVSDLNNAIYNKFFKVK